jgi:hypothetical protein
MLRSRRARSAAFLFGDNRKNYLPEQFGAPPIKIISTWGRGNEMSAQNAETFVMRAKDASDSDVAIKNLVKAVIQLCSAVKDLEAQVRMLKR